jgi:hypothetical protein
LALAAAAAVRRPADREQAGRQAPLRCNIRKVR